MKKTLYQLLGVQQDASAEAISHAYQQAVDRLAATPGHDPNQRIILREAFQVLSHPQKRAAYDASLARPMIAADDFPAARASGPRRRINPIVAMVTATLAVVLIGYLWQARKPRSVAPVVAKSEVVAVVSRGSDTAEPAPEAVDGPAASSVARSAEELYAELSPSVARINVFDSKGSGMAIGSGVLIGVDEVITNCHVTKDGAQFQVKIGGGSYPATVTTADEEFDLCRLRLQGMSGNPVRIGSVSSLRTGQKVYAIGAPHGLELTISDGIVSSLRTVPEGTVIQTTTPTSPGSSGGGLFDASGNLVGIVTFQHKYGQNLNFAVPADWIGKMRSRGVGGVIGNITMGQAEQPAADRSSRQASAGPAARLIGSWHCHDALGGESMQLVFQQDRKLELIADGKSATGTYAFTGTEIGLHFSNGKYLPLSVQNMTDARMIITTRGGSSRRTVCNRT